MIRIIAFFFMISLATAQDWSIICPQVENPPLPESVFMTQVVFDCQDDLYGKIFYTCYNGGWQIMEECRCRSEVDEYGLRWWGVKVNKTEIISTTTGDIQRFCKPSGWGNYDGSLASKCKGFDIYPDTPRGDSINMCAGEGTRRVMCDYTGKWVYVEGECYCPAVEGWDAVLENTNQQRACGSNIEYRYCETSGVWGAIDSSNCSCPSIDNFLETAYGSINQDNRCDNGVSVSRVCTDEGAWGAITYNGLCRCTQEPGWQDGLVGDILKQECSYGRVEVHCNEVGHWVSVQNDCACAADGIWEHAELGETQEKVCGNGGRLRRTCLSTGFWEDVQDFNCECPAEGIWDATPAGEYARAGCSSGFIYRLCGEDGHWTEVYDRSACYCSPQSGWQLTLNNEVAVKACPYGEQTRVCDEWGRWGEIDYSACMCKPQDGFEATPINSYANSTCFDADGVPDFDHYQTRYCDQNGNWGDIDQTQCPVKWCPTVESWYAVPVGLRPTRVTLGCMNGERWRQCNVNGQWGPVNTDNCACTYMVEEELTLLAPGNEYSLSCALGERVYKCNAESGYFDPVDLTTCKCASDGRFPSTAAGELASAACSLGTSVRLCSYDGQWEETDNTRCFCAESGVWRQANYDTTVSILCDSGFRMRVCNDQGFWDDAIQDTCKCVSGDLETPIGEKTIVTCDEGQIVYDCEQGVYNTPDASTCYCASRNEFGQIWNRIPAGSDSPVFVCMNGFSQTRHCGDLTGHWEDLSSENCHCSAEGIWAETPVGEYAYAPCEGHSTGLRRRMCHGSHWDEVDESTCYRQCEFDSGSGEITYVAVDDTIEAPCYVNMYGAETYKCMYNEETNESYMAFVSSTCTRRFCETDIAPFIVHAGESETRECVNGFTGSRTRTCLADGTWDEYDVSDCKPHVCEATTVDGFNFAATVANTYSEAECDAGYHGFRKLFCNMQGEWEQTIVNDCEINVCPSEGDWPATEAFKSHTLPCPEEYTGEWTRTCPASGSWGEPVIPETCIPVPPTLKSIPYEGMKHVSRSPSVALFSSLAIKAPYDACSVSIVSIENPEETYTLTVNATKTSLQGRYRNGGVFADFPLPADADIHDLSNYLKYGEYKAVFPACWNALNGASVPPSQYEVKFHTTAIPPSAPTNIAIHYAASSFTVTFEEPTYVDEPYPVIAYYLSFQPPVFPEVRIDATKRVFGPFPYFAGSVSLLVRAENAYGLSSPDVEVPYSFEEILMDAAMELELDLPAPELVQLYSVAEGANVAVTMGVRAPADVQPFAAYLEVSCNDESVAAFASIYQTEYTFVAAPEDDVDVYCFFRLGNSIGEIANATIHVMSATAEYDAPIVTAFESSAHVLHLSWTEPEKFTTLPIASYIVECKQEMDTAYPISHVVTSLEAFIPVFAIPTGPVECRVAASSSMEASASAAWGMVTVSELHLVHEEEFALEVVQHGSYCEVQMTTSYCVDATATLGETTIDLVCNEEKTKMVGVFSQLALSTTYTIAVYVPTTESHLTIETTTLAEDATVLTSTVMSEYTSSTSAVIHFTSEAPLQLYCMAHTNPVDESILNKQYVFNVKKGSFYPEVASKDFVYAFVDLLPDTTYSVSCVSMNERVYQLGAILTTLVDGQEIYVTRVSSTPNSRLPTFRLEFNAHVISNNPVFRVSCGGKDAAVTAVVESSTESSITYALHGDLLQAGSTCYLRFANLQSILHITTLTHNTHSQLSTTPFPGELAYYEFTVTADAMGPVLQSIELPPVTNDSVTLFTATEMPVSSLEYTLDCMKRGEPTVHRTLSGISFVPPAKAQKGYIDAVFYTGLLPNLHTCTITFPNVWTDAYKNPATCQLVNNLCTYTFISRADADASLDLVALTPANNAKDVAVNAPVVLEFNRDVEAVKEITFRCLECEQTEFTLAATCEGMTCTIVNPAGWQASRTYAIHLDGSAFQAAWEEYTASNMSGYSSFTTAASLCNMEYITEDWNSDCSCMNTGTHCQCTCGATAILKRF